MQKKIMFLSEDACPMCGSINAGQRFLWQRGHLFCLTADDFIILMKSRRSGERVMASISRYLVKVLKLSINLEKSKVAPTNGVTFPSFTFKGSGIRWSDKEFAEYVRGWMNYFGISEYYRPISEIDQCLRRRVRMC